MAATTDVSGGTRIQLDGEHSVFVQNMTKGQFDSSDFVLRDGGALVGYVPPRREKPLWSAHKYDPETDQG